MNVDLADITTIFPADDRTENMNRFLELSKKEKCIGGSGFHWPTELDPKCQETHDLIKNNKK